MNSGKTKIAPNRIVGSTELGEWLDLDPGHIRRLAGRKEDPLPRRGSGKYPLQRCVLWYIQFLRGGEEPGESEAVWKLRKVRAEAELKERKLQELQGKQVPADQVRDMLQQIVVLLDLALDGRAARVAGKLVGLDEQEIEAVLEHDDRRILEDLSRTAILGEESIQPED